MTRAGRWGWMCLVAALVAVTTMIGCGNDQAWNSIGRRSGSPILTLSTSTYTAVAGGSATTVMVTASKADGSADSFTVTASPSGVVGVSKGTPSGTTTPVALSPLTAGTATLTFTSGSDPTLTRTLVATITAAPVPTLTLSTSTYTAVAGGSATTVMVTAIKADGSADSFTVTASPSGVVGVSTGTPSGTTTPVALSPLTAGTATLTFTSGSDPTLTRTLVATITAPPVPTLSLSTSTYAATESDSATTVQVTAAQADGSADSFTVTASPSGVVGVSTGTPSGTTTPVTLTPLTVGTTTLTFTSGSDATLTRTLGVTISSDYNNPTATYALSSTQVFPAPAATTVYVDDRLTLTFDSAPTLGHGAIRIFQASDDTLVDRIDLSGESDTLGVAGSHRRGVRTTPIVINGTTVTITPHRGKLLQGQEYYVGIPATSFTGATLHGQPFEGIGKAAGWAFTVRSTSHATGLSSLTVGPPTDTTVDFHTLQSALDYYMSNSTVSNPVINIKNGTYRELLYLYNRPNVSILGESRAGVILQYDNSEGLNQGAGSSSTGTPTSGGGRSVFLVERCDLLTLDTLTLQNTHIRSGSGTDNAEALFFQSSTATISSGHRLIAKNANFYSEQNTLQLQGYTWYYNTKVSGNVDAIWGNNYVSLFEASTLEMLGDSAYPSTISGYANGTGGTLVQARTYPGGKGFVFADCSLTYADGPMGVHVATGSNASSYLARAVSGSWQDNVAFLNCRMDTHIQAIGWKDLVFPSPSTPTASSGWREYNSMDMSGVALSMSGRPSCSKQLSSTDVPASALGNYTVTPSYPTNADRATIFSAIGWAPAP